MIPFDKPDFARALFEENGDALLFIDPETDVILEANETALRLTGLLKPELIGARATDLLRLEQGSREKDRLRGAAGKTTLFHGKGGFQMRIKDQPGWLPVTVTVTRLHVRPKTLALYTVRDDSERRIALGRAKQAETEVRQSEARYRALVEKSSDGTLIIESNGVIRYVSPAVTRILGHTPLSLEGRSCFEIIHPDDRAAAREKHNEVIANPGAEIPSLFRASHADGRWRDLEITGVNRLDDLSVQGIVLNFRDVTDRRRTEQQVRRQNALMRTLFDAIPDVICQKDREERFTGGNAAFELMIARPVREVVGKTCHEMFTAPWADRLRVTERSVLRTGNPTRVEEWVRYPDGQDVLLDILVSPMGDDDGHIVGLVIVGRDATSRKRLEDQLRQAQKMEAVGQLAGGVAHDFNNLLTVVLGNLELARELARGQVLEDLLKPTEKAAKRAAELTGQLLGFARRAPLQFQPVDPEELIRDTVTLLRHTIDPLIVIEAMPRPGGWWAWADAGQVTQILMNLCLNARDAMAGGGRLFLNNGNITIEPHEASTEVGPRPGEYVRLRVRDTGTGMPEDVRARIFEPFFTTKETGQGTGLGLAVVFGIVQAHDGWIECASEPGRGTTFDVYLPKYRGEVPDPGATPLPSPSPLGRGERVLIADDESMIRTLASTILNQLGYAVTTTEDGEQAVKAFRSADLPFDLVILDLQMPNLSGMDALRQIRAIDPKVPAILASGYSADRMEANGNHVTLLDKPYSLASLGRAVRQSLDARGS
ncbi:PAS domain S-box protein [Limnoglobus roseus]|uniref:histidine kinase n=1 Tax=Limnoglobus roseus TaxID=2598579 RepID=A0A5C1A5Y2_9BACT|nr:PAS domain S-box protein [Limnoglobus roseus]QEL14599.1 PAS domain-containing sensor histidine kinase [Limnoglobus roseus]